MTNPYRAGSRWLSPLLIVATSVLLASCALGPNYQRPDVAQPTGYKEPVTTAPASPAIGSDWWTLFNDAALTKLATDTLAANLDIFPTILEALNATERWHPKTARTLIGRLVKKRALTYKEEGRAYVYRPGISEAEAVSHYSQSFLERVFDGGLVPMLAHFVQSRRLSSSDLRELRGVLDGKE